jgi:hypothetical protein
MLTLKYSGAVVSTLVALFGSLALLSELFGLWTDKLGAGSLVFSGYTGVVTLAVIVALFSVVSLVLYRQVTKDVAKQPDYVTTTSYNFITNGFFGMLVFVLIVLVAELLSILVSSLLLIGTSTDIGGMYLGEFLPVFMAAGVVALAAFAAYKILKGKNVSALMTVVLVSLAGALLLATLITVPIKAHTSTSSAYDYSKYLQTYIDSRN